MTNEEQSLLNKELIYACCHEEIEMIEECLRAGADMYFSYSYAFMECIKTNNIKIAQKFIDNGFDIKIHYNSFIIECIERENIDFMKYIFSMYGSYNDNKHEFIIFALYNKKYKMAKYLLSLYEKDGFDIIGYIMNNRTGPCLSCSSIKEDVVKSVIEEL